MEITQDEQKKQECINYIKECDKADFYDVFDIVRERHNNKMLN